MRYVFIAVGMVFIDILINRFWLGKTTIRSKVLVANIVRIVFSIVLVYLLGLPLGLYKAKGGYIPFIFGLLLFGASLVSLRTAFSQNALEKYLPLRYLLQGSVREKIFLLGFVVPIGEEFLFRGVVQNLMTKAAGPILGGILSVSVFVGVHIGNVVSGFETREQFKKMLLGRILITGILTWLYQESQSIWPVIFIHALQDLGTYLVVFWKIKTLGSGKLPRISIDQESRTDIESSG